MTEIALTRNTEVRKLQLTDKYNLARILSVSDSWKKLMAIVPKEDSDIPKFNSEHISILEQSERFQGRNAAQVFLDEWGTMGRNRPTLGSLQQLLIKAELYRAADYIAKDLLNEQPPERLLGPAAPIDTSDEALVQLLEEQVLSDSSIGTKAELTISGIICAPVDGAQNKDDNLGKITFNHQQDSTNGNFSDFQFHVTEKSTLPAVHENRELVSEELPVFLNECERIVDKKSGEIVSDELPICLNVSNSSLNDVNSSSDDSLNIPYIKSEGSNITGTTNVLDNQIEMTSSELPQCVINFGSSR